MDDPLAIQDQNREELDQLIRLIRRGDVASHDQIHQFYGDRVLKHDTASGDKLAIKFELLSSHSDNGLQTEADMMHYAATHGVLAPKVRAVYDIHKTSSSKPSASAMVSDRLPGQRLSEVWADLTKEGRKSIIAQLREQIGNKRACTQSYIGRLNNRSTCNVYEPVPVIGEVCGPFIDEEHFDRWCLDRVPDGLFGFTKRKWARWLEKERQRPLGKFVLTHGDLSPSNIIVDGGVVTGIVDWERSGFWPEYAEYAFAMELFPKVQRRKEECKIRRNQVLLFEGNKDLEALVLAALSAGRTVYRHKFVETIPPFKNALLLLHQIQRFSTVVIAPRTFKTFLGAHQTDQFLLLQTHPFQLTGPLRTDRSDRRIQVRQITMLIDLIEPITLL
ncbi:hypothetical protein DHEL01_v208972 [Diaporthe helianthi]|uniref:Aminoglycoside phosphotransferase domain-containing protein n=1 Tax=Diaporthe helianthi TaxID=158607 RepID=A0A2P5HQX9_DIAHE|nr:hypothetical protein DHEL01_v208972 [Diaporthe helianthi]